MTALAAFDAAADFAGGEDRRVHVGVGRTGADRAHDLIELPGGDSLAGGGNHLLGPDRPGDGARLGALWSDRATQCRHGVLGSVGLAQPYHDSADRVLLAEVNMGLGDRSLPSPDALVAQLVMDRACSVVDHGPETPASVGRYRTTLRGGRVGAVNLVVTGKPGGEPVAFVPVVVRHCRSGEADRKRGERRRNRPWHSRCHVLPPIGLTRYFTL